MVPLIHFQRYYKANPPLFLRCHVVEEESNFEDLDKKQTECNSCIHFQTCEHELKGSLCRKYKTDIILVFNGHQIRFQCIPNDRWSDWYTSAQIDEHPELQYEIAQALAVRPEDIWTLLLDKPLPKAHAQPDFPDFDLDDDKKLDKQHVRFKVAEWLLGTYHFATMLDTRETYVYSEGIYEPEAEELIVAAIRRALDKKCNIVDRNETIAMVQDNTLLKRSVFHHNPDNKICLENGVLDLDTQEFRPHNPLDYFLTRLPIKFDPDAQCPKIDKFHSEIVDETDVETLFEIIGYCLYRQYPLHKAVMLVGGGSNGKSTWLNMVKSFLGTENCSSVNLQKLEVNRFATAALAGKYANIYPDLSDQALHKTGTFKILVGGDLIGAEKKFGKHFTFQNHAKLLFSANKIPETKDDSDAFFRRWLIIVFGNKFTQFSEKKADPDLLRKLTTPEEMSGLFNKAMAALQRLLDRHVFHGDKPTAEWRVDYIRKSDPIAAFYMDCLEEVNDSENYVSKTALYQAYIRYCKNNKLPVVDNSVFSKKIKANFQWAEAKKKSIEGLRIPVWIRLHLKDVEIEQDQQKTLMES